LLAFSRDGKSAIVRDTVPQAVDVKKTEAAKASSHATVYEVPSGKKVFQLTEESWIDQAQFTAAGNSIVTVVALNRIGVWNVKGQRRAFQRKSIDNVRAFALSGDGKRMYASKVMDVPNRSFVEWELEENRVARRFDVPYATLLLVSPDGKTLAVSRGSNITVFETRQGKLLSRWDTGLQDVTCMRFSGSGPYLAAGGSGGMIKIWKVDQGPQ
jgi:tricorn protease-like protein